MLETAYMLFISYLFGEIDMVYEITKLGKTSNVDTLADVGKEFLTFGQGKYDLVIMKGKFVLRFLHWTTRYLVEELEFYSFEDLKELAEKEILEKVGQLVIDTNPDSRNWWHDRDGAFDAEKK